MSSWCQVVETVMWLYEFMLTEIIPQVWPASPSPSLPWPSAAQPSLHDASPAVHTNHQRSWWGGYNRGTGIVPWGTHSQFCSQEQWAPPPLSSSGWSEPRSETAAQPDLSPDASCGCPAIRPEHTVRNECVVCLSGISVKIVPFTNIYSHQNPLSLHQGSLGHWYLSWTYRREQFLIASASSGASVFDWRQFRCLLRLGFWVVIPSAAAEQQCRQKEEKKQIVDQNLL